VQFHSQGTGGGVAGMVQGREFKPQYCKERERERNHLFYCRSFQTGKLSNRN
jgi:hypothetical protein